MSLTDDAMEQVERLFKENIKLRARAEEAERQLADLRGQIAADLNGVAAELQQRADEAGADNRTGQTILLVQAEAYAAAAKRVATGGSE